MTSQSEGLSNILTVGHLPEFPRGPLLRNLSTMALLTEYSHDGIWKNSQVCRLFNLEKFRALLQWVEHRAKRGVSLWNLK